MGWVIGAMIGGFACLMIIGAIATKRRTEAWQRVADELGLTFQGKQNDVLQRFGNLRLLSRGRSQRFSNVVSGGTEETEITIGDFRYRTGSGKNSHTHNQTVCLLEDKKLDLPHCCLRPESRFFNFLGGLFGGQDIDFDDDPDFSGAFVLQGDDEQAVRTTFDPPTRAWFAGKKGERLHFEAHGPTLLFHTGRRIKPGQTRQLMQQALEVLKLLGK